MNVDGRIGVEDGISLDRGQRQQGRVSSNDDATGWSE
jgi:hypothetical protein